MYTNDFYNISAVLPPSDEQDQIVAYLRAQDAKIARFIRTKKALIELLNEQKQTLIQRAVTRGIDSAVEVRPSGIDWLGDIPEHWDSSRLKYVARFNPSKSESIAYKDSSTPVSFVPMERVTNDRKLLNPQMRPASDLWEGFTYFRRGDVVLAKITPCFENGKGGCPDNLPTEIGFGTTEFLVLRPIKGAVLGKFLDRLVSLKTFRSLGTEAMTGVAGQQRVPLDFVKNFTVPLPPEVEQEKILEWLSTATQQLDVTIACIAKEIEVLQEYRERLISDVVTGQIDVRTWKPGKDDTPTEEDFAAIAEEEDPPEEDLNYGD